jgi:hypothetical protein
MSNSPIDTCATSDCKTSTGVAEQLNKECFCQTLDRTRLDQILKSDEFQDELLAQHPQLFSNIATFISRAQFDSIKASVKAIERVISLPSYQRNVLKKLPGNPPFEAGPAGVFMGYDFHLTTSGPKLIEINTNAGGAFLNALLISAQVTCCPPMQVPLALEKEKLFGEFVRMFLNEWQLQRGNAKLKRIAIVDAEPEKQFLFPEFKIAQKIFQASGIETIITAPEKLAYEQNQLLFEGRPVDLVYNRLTDFSLSDNSNKALRLGYENNAVVVTPNPYHHAIYANKRNLILLSDDTALQQIGVEEADRRIVNASVPATCEVSLQNASDLWQRRKELFFKPVAGYGGKATYRGDKLTKRVWENILQGQYIAQQQVAPSMREVLLDGQSSSLKMDVRAYTYQGNIQLLAARLYQGQTTNFRTAGGGFSTVFVI